MSSVARARPVDRRNDIGHRASPGGLLPLRRQRNRVGAAERVEVGLIDHVPHADLVSHELALANPAADCLGIASDASCGLRYREQGRLQWVWSGPKPAYALRTGTSYGPKARCRETTTASMRRAWAR